MSDKTKMLTTHRQGSPEEIKNYLEDQKKPNVYAADSPLYAREIS